MTNRSTSWFPKNELNGLFAKMRTPNLVVKAPAKPAVVVQAPAPAPAPIPAPTPPPAPVVQEVAAPSQAAVMVATEQLLKWKQQSQALIEVARSKEMSRGLLQESLEFMTQKAAETLQVERVSVWFYDEANMRLSCQTLYKRSANTHLSEAPFDGERHPEYFAAILTEPLIISSHATTDPTLAELAQEYLIPNHIASVLASPFFSGGKLKGIINFEHTGQTREWDASEEQFAASIAEFIALAIESSERKKAEESILESEARLKLQGAALMRLARSEHLSRGNQAEALREITEAAAETLNCERASIWLLKPDYSSIYCIELFVRAQQSHESGLELKAEQFPEYFDAIKTERNIDAHDAQTDPRTSCFTESYLKPLGITSMLDAPIRVGGAMVGVICHEHIGRARTWLLEELQFAASLADFIALAMEANERRKAQAELKQMLQLMKRFVPGSENPGA
jgi:GAF domain-containing protein